MKIALLGNGKTGSKILELSKEEITIFDRQNLPSLEKLKGHDVIISFLPGDSFMQLIPLLLESKLPVVTGSTGFIWPVDLNLSLKTKNLSWIYASNFSLGVVVLKQLIHKLNEFSSLFEDKTFSIHETHHTEKLDAPSGTAISMKQWLKKECDITSTRFGDVIGLHTLKLETSGEIIKIEHEAKDRRLFAQGALWAANLITKKKVPPGLNNFQEVVEKDLSL